MRIKTSNATFSYGTKCQNSSFPFFPGFILTGGQLGLQIFEMLKLLFEPGVPISRAKILQQNRTLAKACSVTYKGKNLTNSIDLYQIIQF